MQWYLTDTACTGTLTNISQSQQKQASQQSSSNISQSQQKQASQQSSSNQLLLAIQLLMIKTILWYCMHMWWLLTNLITVKEQNKQ